MNQPMSQADRSGRPRALVFVFWAAMVGLAATMLGLVLLVMGVEPMGQILAFGGIGLLLLCLAPGTVLASRARKQNEARKAEAVELMGFQRAPGDPFGLVAMRFPLFEEFREPRKGLSSSRSAGGVSDTMWGRWNGVDVKVFTYGYTETTYSTSSGTTHSRTEMACAAVTDLPTQMPGLSLTREGMFSKVASALGGGDVKIGYPAFDKAFKIWSADEGFARWFLRPEMMDWMLALPQKWNFEVVDNAALCHKKDPMRDPRAACDVVAGFVSVMPRELFAPVC